MKKILTTIFLVIMILTVAGVVFAPHQAQACSLVPFDLAPCATEITAWVGNILLALMGQVLTITGVLLSFSIKLTLNIGNIYNSTPAIKNVWVIIRNISSIFIIFYLLYASIMTIIGNGTSEVKKLVGNIIMAGLLINFSLFFTKLAVDASNLVSMQFYRAIAPQSASINASGWESSYFDDGGLSNIFMSSLKIQQIYHPSNTDVKKSSTGEGTVWFSIIIATYGGILLMLFAAISFLGAAIAFSIRTGVLLLLMAFSPVYFIGMIFPEIDKAVSQEWWKYLKTQLIFMPVYLLFMYVALSIISDKGFLSFISSGNLQDATTGSTTKLIGIVIQYFIAILFINAPLIAALKFSPIGAGFTDKLTKGLRDKIYNSPKVASGIVARNTLGRFGGALGSSFDSMAAKYQNRPMGKVASSFLRATGVSQAVRGGMSSMEKGKYGGSKNREDIVKENKDRSKVISGVQRTKTQMDAIGAVIGPSATPTPAQVDSFKEILGKMNGKEIEKLDFDTINNPTFTANLSSSQVDKVLESDSLTEQQKETLKVTRKTSLGSLLNTSTPAILEKHMRNISGKELLKADPTIFTRNEVLDQLTPSQLQDMRDLNGTTKAAIGRYISALPPGSSHKAVGYIRKDLAEWS